MDPQDVKKKNCYDNYLISSLGRLKNKKTNKFLDGYTPQTDI